LPLWEAGVGLSALSLPDYRGSAATSRYLLPVPYVRYRGEFLKADRDGLRGLLYAGDRVELNLSVNGTPPADSDDNSARAGMADLEPTLEIGPTVDFHLWRSPDDRMQLDFRLPLRAAITVESSPRHIGWLLWPALKLEVDDPPGLPGWELDVQGGPVFSSSDYNSYFYSVGAADATAVRPEYSAAAGYSGAQARLSLTRRFARYWVGGYLRYDNLARAVFEDSPLVEKTSGVSAGLVLSWVFAESSRRVDAED
jgi:outer membrane scaffolding protein for murein synthesis (MipA/OmpV family)